MVRANPRRMNRWWRRHADAAAATRTTPMPAGGAASSDIYQRLRLPRTLNYPATSLGQMLDQSAQRFPHAPAIAFGDERWTYGELLTQVNRLAGGLARHGVQQGDRVMMTLPNSPDFVLCFLALQKLGAVLVNAGPLMGTDSMRELMRMTEPRMVIALDLQAGTLRQIARDQTQVVWLWSSLQAYQPLWKRVGYQVKRWQTRERIYIRESHTMVSDLLADAPARPPTVAPAPEEVAVLQPTGGTTGTLKVAQLTHHSLLCNATQLIAWSGLRQGQERMFAVLPMFHVYGLMLSLIVPVFSTSLSLPMPRFGLDAFMELLREHRPNVLPVVPAIIELLCQELEKRPDETVLEVLSQAFVLSGAAPLPTATGERFERLTGNRIVQGYGLTEASPVTHANPLHAPRPGSIGLAMPDTHIRLADLDDPTRDAPPGEPGELVVRGPQLMRGYDQNPEETAHMLRTDARGHIWLYTGDVARVDEDGYVYLIDRRKHMINHAGLKVWPARIEQLLQSHRDVKDAAAIGRPDQVHGESVTAVVVAHDHADTSTLAEELRTLCREHLAPYEVPSRFEFVRQLPRSPLGKLLKYQLDATDKSKSASVATPGPHTDRADERHGAAVGNGEGEGEGEDDGKLKQEAQS